MDDSYPSPWRIWEGPQDTAVQELFGPPGAETLRPTPTLGDGIADLADVADQLYACEALRPSRRRDGRDNTGEPFSLQWFLSIEHYRHAREAKWIPRLLEFAKHHGETLLGLGHGLGTDWLQYARNGSSVVVCSPCQSQLALIRRNFQLRGLEGRFLHALPTALPLDNCSVDVVCLNGLLEQVADPAALVDEVYRVLKPGGKVIAVTAAKYDINFWADLMLWWRWLPRRGAVREPGVRFSGRRLCRLFRRFEEHRVCKRQLRRAEVPHLWRLVPLALLERLMGRVLVVKAFKPVSTAILLQAAA